MTTANIIGLTFLILFFVSAVGWGVRLYQSVTTETAKVLPAKNLGEGIAMTHEEMFLQFCAAAGLKPRVADIPLLGQPKRLREYQFEAKESPKVEGYSGFLAEFVFNNDGTFVEINIGE